MMERVERLIERPWKMLGFYAVMIFGYLRPDQMAQAVLAYGILVGGNVGIEHVRGKNGKGGKDVP
jgi:hypothetical protein